MSQVMVTIVAPLDPARLGQAQDAIDLLGNPPKPELRARLDVLDAEGRGVHFMSRAERLAGQGASRFRIFGRW
jgi:hypothetical protein